MVPNILPSSLCFFLIFRFFFFFQFLIFPFFFRARDFVLGQPPIEFIVLLVVSAAGFGSFYFSFSFSLFLLFSCSLFSLFLFFPFSLFLFFFLSFSLFLFFSFSLCLFHFFCLTISASCSLFPLYFFRYLPSNYFLLLFISVLFM